ncbi:MAG: hypothetical protein AMXMBFR53_39730 [Gemmatimonadota bacterium]
MSPAKHIRAHERCVLEEVFRPGDSVLSAGDILHASACLEERQQMSPRLLGSSLVVLGHVLTRLVLSERVVAVFSTGIKGEVPLLLQEIRKWFPIITVEPSHPVFTEDNLESVEEFRAKLGWEVVQAFQNGLYTAFGTEVDDYSLTGFLGDYHLSYRIPPSFAPNPFLSKDLAVLSARKQGLDDHLVSLVEELRLEVCEDANLLRQCHIYDLRVPAVFGTILKSAKDPDDIIPLASQMHAHAQGFRQWSAVLESEDDPLPMLDDLREVERVLKRLCQTLDSTRDERIQVSPLPGLVSVAMPFSATPAVERAAALKEVEVRNRKALGFLLNLHASARRLKSVEAEISRVFALRPTFARDTAVWIRSLL